jgi:acetyl esterase/lipase
MTTRQNVLWIGLVILLFLGALFWAEEQDPFSRKWFTLKTANGDSVKCVAVLPKPMRKYPVVIYAHGSGGALMNDGNDLRQMAELGLAVVSLEYDQTNGAIFNTQFDVLLHYLGQQKWVNTNAIAWVGSSLGANCLLDFVLQHPEQQPQLLVQLSGAGLPEGQTNGRLESLHYPVLLVHGEQDEIFPLADTKRLVSVLQISDVSAELKIIPDAPHDMGLDRAVVFRCIGEYCLTHLTGKNAWQNYYSIAQWQAGAPSFWLFCIPAIVWAVGWFAWWRSHKVVPPEKIELGRSEIALRWLAILLATWALSETAVHLVTPYFSVNDTTFSIARRFLVQLKERDDFEYLAAQPIWHGQKLKTLLEHVELSGYNRELINWQVDEEHYQDYILSPVITGNPGEQLNWRRSLWEEFYPRIRHESSPEDAAQIVARHLRERVTVATLSNLSNDIPIIWLRQITDETGFEIIYVAALRSVGVPARLNSQHQTEYWDGNRWQTAPQPCVVSW